MQHVSAKIGGTVAAVTVVWILHHLVNATAPVPMGVVLSSEASSPIAVQRLEVDGRDVLPAGWTASTAQAMSASSPHASAALALGRPARITAALSAPKPTAVSCELAPRPHGECVVQVRVLSPESMRCDFECSGPVPGK